MIYTQIHTYDDYRMVQLHHQCQWLRGQGVGVCHMGYLDQQLGGPGSRAITSDLLRDGRAYGSRIELRWPGSVIIGNASNPLSWLFPPCHREVAVLFKLTWGGQ